MKIQIGVNQKMKLYNVYRICKRNIEEFNDYTAKKNEKTGLYILFNWENIKHSLELVKKIPSFRKCINDYIFSVPVLVRENVSPELDSSTAQKINSKLKVITTKMQTIIELYESMNLGDGGSGIDIKMPPCDDLKNYIAYLKDIEFIFSQCPFLQCENEVLKFDSVDVGSNWLKLTIATASTCMILNNTAALIDKAIILRSHYVSIRQQEEILKSQQNKNELSKEIIESYKFLHNTYMNAAISMLEKDLGDLKDPEERDKAERSLEKLVDLLDKGCEIYATLDAPDDVQALFPEMQSNLELPDNIVKYLEEKEQPKNVPTD